VVVIEALMKTDGFLRRRHLLDLRAVGDDCQVELPVKPTTARLPVPLSFAR